MEENLKWYIAQVYANSEIAVKANIIAMQDEGFLQSVKDIYVPTFRQMNVSPKGKKTIVEKAVYSGYIYIQLDGQKKADLSCLSGVSKFSKLLGDVSDSDFETIKIKLDKEARDGGIKYRVSFEENDKVRVTEGSWANYIGTISEFLPEDSIVKLVFSILGREQEVEMSIEHVELVLE